MDHPFCIVDETETVVGSDGTVSQRRKRRSTTSGDGGDGNETFGLAVTTTGCQVWDDDLADWVIAGEVRPHLILPTVLIGWVINGKVILRPPHCPH